jgi:hypothetical protein
VVVRVSTFKRLHASTLQLLHGTLRLNFRRLVEVIERVKRKPVYVKKLIYKECPRFVSVEEEMMALQGHKSIVCSKVLNDETNRKTDSGQQDE